MNFLRALPFLALGAVVSAQALDLKPKGGGELKIGGTTYRFELTNLTSAPPKSGLPGAVKLEGNLVPADGGAKLHMGLTVLKGGGLYMLRVERKAAGSYPDNWAATTKTWARPLKLEDRPGGRVEIQCGGGLTGVIAQRPQEATWSGTLWAVFPGGD
jgi:hypothetical protein